MTYEVTLYKNTGFNAIDRPSNPSVLESAEKIAMPANYYWQSEPLASIRCAMTYQEAWDVDYVKVERSYYTVNGIQMLNENCVEFSLLLDPILTAGGINSLTIIDGWVERAHAKSDKLFENIIDEDFTPSQELKILPPRLLKYVDDEDIIHTLSGRYFADNGTIDHEEFISSNVDLDSIPDQAQTFVNTTFENDVTVPGIPEIVTGQGAEYLVSYSGNIRRYKMPLVKVYHLNRIYYGTEADEILKAIKWTVSLNISSCLRDAYMVPRDYIERVTHATDEQITDAIRVTNIKGIDKEVFTQMPWKYGNYVPKNNKVFAFWNDYTIINPTAGTVKDFKAREIYNDDHSEPTFRFYVDPSPNGAPYVAPSTFEGSTPLMFQQAVRGSGWLNVPLGVTGGEGAGLAEFAAARDIYTRNQEIQDQRAHYATGFIGGVLGGSINTAVSGMGSYINTGDEVDSIKNLYQKKLSRIYNNTNLSASDRNNALLNLDASFNDINMSTPIPTQLPGYLTNGAMEVFNRKMGVSDQDFIERQQNRDQVNRLISGKVNRIKAPTILFTQDPNLQGYVGNSFWAYKTCLSDIDLEKFDKYLTQYGYAQNKKLEKTDLNNRQYFNYIKTIGANVKCGEAIRMNNLIDDELNAGVRLWHVLPNANAMNNNPIRGGQ